MLRLDTIMLICCIHTTTVYTSVFEYSSIKRSQLQPSFLAAMDMYVPPFKFLKVSG